MDQSAQVSSTTLRNAEVLMRRFPSHIEASVGALRFSWVVVPYPTIVVCAPSDLSSVPWICETCWFDALRGVLEE